MRHQPAAPEPFSPPLLLTTISIAFTVSLSTPPGLAQSVTTNITQTVGAGSLGTVVLPPEGNVYNINGGTVKTGPTGSNLFHSFGDFNLAANDIASFNNTTGVANISNILSRVTGENPSHLFGTMRSTIPGANFFFMNPNGVVFGPEARLDMSGAASFTTANHITLTDGLKFNLSAMSDVLTSAPVASFGFLGPNAASIYVQSGNLTVAEGQTLALVGGDRQFVGPDGEMVPPGVTINGSILSAPSGQIHLVSVASTGEATMPTEGISGLGVETFSSLGAVGLSGGALLDTSTLTDADGIPLSTYGGGTVSIRSGQFVMDASSIMANTLSSGDGATTAVSIQTSGDITISNGSTIWSSPCFAFPCGTGRTGNIQLTAQKVLLEYGSGILTATATDIPTVTPEITNPVGGNVSVSASEFEVMSGSLVYTFSSGLGDGGKISITATDHVKVSGFDPNFGTESQIATFEDGAGKGGAIEIWSPKIAVEDLGSLVTSSFGPRRSGAISLHVDELTLARGGQISSLGGDFLVQGYTLTDARDVSLFGYGEGDRVSRIDMTGSGAEGGEDSGAGLLSIRTARLWLTDEARINSDANLLSGGLTTILGTESVRVENGAKIRVGGGNGGSLEITAPMILLDRGSLQTTSGPALVSGPVTVNTRSLTLQNGSQIISGQSSFSGPTEGGGDVTIRGFQGPGSSADTIIITGKDGAGSASGIYSATAGTLPGGNISISARTVTLQDGGTLNSTAAGTIAEGTGGNITIVAAQDIVLASNASVSASSTGAGDAGNITALAGDDFVMQNSSITTEAAQASGGNIKLGATDQVILQNSVVSASVLGSSGGGGDVNIDPNFVILQNSQVLAQAVQGPGGNIFITTNFFLADQNSLVDASSQFGVNGTVTIQSPANSLSGGIRPLPQGMLQAATLLHQRCAAQLNGQASSFVVAGRDALPPEPGTWLASAVLPEDQSDAAIDDGFLAEVEPVSETPFLSLRRMHVSGPFAYALPDEWARCGS